MHGQIEHFFSAADLETHAVPNWRLVDPAETLPDTLPDLDASPTRPDDTPDLRWFCGHCAYYAFVEHGVRADSYDEVVKHLRTE